MNSYSPTNWPPVTKNLIIINVLIWLVEYLFPGFANNALLKFTGLHLVTSDLFNPAQIFTYMFLHFPSTPLHVFFNMFTLWMFGRMLEQVWGSKRFLAFYIICGIGAALVQECVWMLTWKHDYISAIARANGMTYDHMKEIVEQAVAAGDGRFLRGMAEMRNSMLTVGASGAVFGVLLGFAFVFPNIPMYLFFIPIPIKAKYMVAGYAVLEFFFGVGRVADSVAHFAHLGGMIFGLAMLLYWRKKGTLR
ncbi:MAG: rhomboid family intramembrane serine protease [Muribaculaceae bacterium]|nr:rhomboid family intramembrane serine protease [Bacteroidales bacterium]MDE6071028.1 rhomboid family intramembrane serine protease [Muribaculaceae bacterium]